MVPSPGEDVAAERGETRLLFRVSELTCVLSDPLTVLQSEGISLQATSCSEELQRCRVNALEAERQVQQDLVGPSPAS